jgi:hypothetical protein
MKHTYYECKCTRQYCQFCDGGLYACTVCKGFEGSLTTDCPGVPLTEEQDAMIYNYRVWDYREDKGGWCFPDGTGHSMGDDDIRVQRGDQIEAELERRAIERS